jgi:hypothetical protein
MVVNIKIVVFWDTGMMPCSSADGSQRHLFPFFRVDSWFEDLDTSCYIFGVLTVVTMGCYAMRIGNIGFY